MEKQISTTVLQFIKPKMRLNILILSLLGALISYEKKVKISVI